MGQCEGATGDCVAVSRDDGTDCGDSADSTCDGRDTCESGECVANVAQSGTPCPVANECDTAACDGSGACVSVGTQAAGTPCGLGTDDACTDPDTCDGGGNCLDNHAVEGSPCGDQGVACRRDDRCNDSGTCLDQGLEPTGTACGSAADTECTDPDTCDIAGTCRPNHAIAGAQCGDQGVDCLFDDQCDGSGLCLDMGFASVGTPCGDPLDTDCTNRDRCNAAAVCLPKHETDGAGCGDCVAGEPCGTCTDGSCPDADCAVVEELGCGDVVMSRNDALGSTFRTTVWTCATFDLTGPEIAYRFVPDGTGLATARLTGLTADLDLLVIRDTVGFCVADDPASCVPDGYSANAGTSDELVTWPAEAGQSYFVIVDGYAGAISDFTLTVDAGSDAVVLSEVSGEMPDYVEVRNRGACAVDVGSFALRHAPSCDAPFDFQFPFGSVVDPGGVFRMVENAAALPNEASLGRDYCDFGTDGEGFTLLCLGPCDLAGCNNVVDYMERGASPTGAPGCVGFEPAPVTTSGVGIGESLHRTEFDGAPNSWHRSDWTVGTVSRDP